MQFQIKNRSVRAILLLLSLVISVCLLSAGVVASGGDPTLTVYFESEECDGILLTYSGSNTVPITENGQTVTIPYGVPVKVTVAPKMGYELESITDAQGTDVLSPNGDYFVQSFVTASEITVGCKTSVFDVKFEMPGADLTYETAEGGTAGLKNLTYSYKDTAHLTYLPEVKRVGYTFDHWELIKQNGEPFYTITTKDDNGYYIPGDIINTDMVTTKTLYVHAVFTADKQPVVRYDHVYNEEASGHRDALLGKTEWQIEMDSVINALERMEDDTADAYKSYIGYDLVTELSEYPSHTVTMPTEGNPTPNVLYRLYRAIAYTLQYQNPDGSALVMEGAPATYTFKHSTAIPNPTRRGYTFTGWTMTVKENGQAKDIEGIGKDFTLGLDDANLTSYISEDRVIILTAQWVPNTYSITYDWSGKDAAHNTLLDAENESLPRSFVFDAEGGVRIPNPTRAGYTFSHWILSYQDEATGDPATLQGDPVEGYYTFASDLYAQGITLKAVWTVNSYTVKLDGNGATTLGTATLPVTFDAALVIPSGFGTPSRVGFTFDGYWSEQESGGTQYIDAEGKSVCDVWDLSNANEAGEITLYARWIRNSYDITVNITGATGATVVIVEEDGTRHPYSGTPIPLPYDSKFTVEILSPAGYKVVKWRGVTLSEHQKSFVSSPVTVEANAMTLTATVLVMATVPEVAVDYPGESLVLPSGNYRIYLDTTVLEVVISSSGAITVNGQAETAVRIPDGFFGHTVSVVRYGTGIGTADSDPADLSLAARPEVPKTPDEVHSVDNTFEDHMMVNMKPGLLAVYEFAYSTNPDPDGAVWSDSPLLEGMTPGTLYYVFVRVKATATAPHGEEFVVPYATRFKGYVEEKLEELAGLLEDDDGDITKALIEAAKEEIAAIAEQSPLPEDFYQQVETIMERVSEQLAFARLRDAKIAALEQYLAACLSSGSFSSENCAILSTVCADAVTSIASAATDADVDRIYETARGAMELIPMTYLYDADHTMQLVSLSGLPQGSALSMVRFQDFGTLSRSVDAAIRTSGKVFVNGSFMTLGEAESLLRSLELVAAYSMRLTTSAASADGSFELRLLIPEDLEGKTGLQVAYFDSESGMLELLPTRVEGEYLIFTSTRVADFVIFADPVVELGGLIIALGAILFCQLIALAVILAGRISARKKQVHAVSVLPTAFLAVHFLPANGVLIVAILGGLVILLQILLMWLLLSSHMIRRRKSRRAPTPTYEEPVEETPSEEEAEVGEAEDANATGAMLFVTEEDPFAIYGEETERTEEWSEEDFIEPAATTRYSLPEDGEESELASDDEYTETPIEESEYAYSYGEEEIYPDEEVYSDEDAYTDEAIDADESLDSEEAYSEESYAEDEYPEEGDSVDAYAEESEYEPDDRMEGDAHEPYSEEELWEEDEDSTPEATLPDDSEDDPYRYDVE